MTYQKVSIDRFPVGTRVVLDNVYRGAHESRVRLEEAPRPSAKPESVGIICHRSVANGNKFVVTLDGQVHDVKEVEVPSPTLVCAPPSTIVQWDGYESYRILPDTERFNKDDIAEAERAGSPLYLITGAEPGVAPAINLCTGLRMHTSDYDENHSLSNAFDFDIFESVLSHWIKSMTSAPEKKCCACEK